MARRKRRLSMKGKINIMLILLLTCGFCVLIGRLVKLQVIDGDALTQKEIKQQLTTTVISANRGTIYDRNMVPLAESATVSDVVVSPNNMKTAALKDSIADNLSKILNMDRQTIRNLLNKDTGYQVVTKKISKDTADAVKKYIKDANLGCIWLIDDSQRYYPNGDFASQVIGFTGTDNQGLCGIEAQYDSVLKGVAGRKLSAKTAKGGDMPNGYADYVAPQNGNNVVLTIDEVVQHYLETALVKAVKDNNVANKATGIVMNVKTGEILGMATVPSFNPNTPFTITDDTVKTQLATLSGSALATATSNAQQAQWRNKAISDPYEPGSVFKVITAAAGLEEGVVNENTVFPDPGYYKVADTTYVDWNNSNNGNPTFLQGFEQSWNVVFIQLGLNLLGAHNFYNYFSSFGLTQKTGIDLPGEANSIYHDEKDLLSNKVSLASCSFGQTNKLTAIQMITAIAAATNGGYLVQPRMVKEVTDQDGNIVKSYGTTVKRQVISSETSERICNLMEKEVLEGSGMNAYVAGYRVGGKTGTADKTDEQNNKKGVIASFAGVAPCDDPEIAVLIVLDEPHASNGINFGGVIAAPVGGTIFSEILPYLGVEPKYTSAELQSISVKVPNLSGKSLTDATNTLKSQGLNVSPVGNGSTVTGQSPGMGGAIQKNGTVVVYLGGAGAQNATVPHLIGLSSDQASSVLTAAGLNVKFVGLAQSSKNETAYEADYAEGASVPKGTVVTVKFRDNSLGAQ